MILAYLTVTGHSRFSVLFVYCFGCNNTDRQHCVQDVVYPPVAFFEINRETASLSSSVIYFMLSLLKDKTSASHCLDPVAVTVPALFGPLTRLGSQCPGEKVEICGAESHGEDCLMNFACQLTCQKCPGKSSVVS